MFFVKIRPDRSDFCFYRKRLLIQVFLGWKTEEYFKKN